MRTVHSLDEAVAALVNQKSLFVLLEDWEEGLTLCEEQEETQVKGLVEAARRKYGARFTFRAFNEDLDVWWNGELGVVCAGKPTAVKEVMLATDYRRFPGVAVFRTEDLNDERYDRVLVEEIREAHRVVYLRFVKLLKVGEDSAANQKHE
jgi:hypothetical protein